MMHGRKNIKLSQNMYRVNMINESIRSKTQYMININIVFKIEYYIYKRVHSVLYYKPGQYKMD